MLQGAIFDICGNLPIFFYWMVWNYPQTEARIEDAKGETTFNVCMVLKLLRLAHFMQVTDALRKVMEKLGEIFFLYRYMFSNLL